MSAQYFNIRAFNMATFHGMHQVATYDRLVVYGPFHQEGEGIIFEEYTLIFLSVPSNYGSTEYLTTIMMPHVTLLLSKEQIF